jgi:hypothetical protein
MFHLWGTSKIAKSLVGAIGQSVWGQPKVPGEPDAFGASWTATAVGLERYAVLRSDVGGYFDEIVDALATAYSEFDAAVTKIVVDRDELTLYVTKEHIRSVARTMRDDPALRFELLANLSGVDYIGSVNRFHVVYNLTSMTYRRQVRLETSASLADPHVPSVTAVYPGASAAVLNKILAHEGAAAVTAAAGQHQLTGVELGQTRARSRGVGHVIDRTQNGHTSIGSDINNGIGAKGCPSTPDIVAGHGHAGDLVVAAAAAEQRNILTVLLLDLQNLCRSDFLDQSGIIPFRLIQRPGKNNFGQGIHRLSNLRIIRTGLHGEIAARMGFH